MPFEPELAGVCEHARAVAFDMLVEPNAGPGFGHDRCERRLADLERIAAEIVAVQLNKVEGIQEHNGVVSAVTDAIEIRHSSIVAGAKTLECTGQSAGVSDQRVWMRQNNGVIVNQLPTPVIL
jgi:D-serine deaminase-like pyridoxal phosphate-dependent protein